MIICQKCGSSLPEAASFCGRCGVMIRPSNTPASSAFSAPLYLWDTPTIPTLPAISEKPARQSVHIFISYARQDQSLCDQLANHLSNLEYRGLITTWTAREIGAGEEISQYIDTHLGTAYIILLLISANFLASEDRYSREVMQAIQYHEREEALVIPVLLRPVSFKDALFASLPSLPTNREPVVNWQSRESAFVDIALGIERVIQGYPVSPLPQVIGSYTSPEIIIKSYRSDSLALNQPQRTSSRKRRGFVFLGLSLLVLLAAALVLVLNPHLIPFAAVQIGSLTPFVEGLLASLTPFVGVLIGSLMVVIGVLLLIRVLAQRARARIAQMRWQEESNRHVLEESWWQAEEEARQVHEEAQWQEQERAYYEKALVAYERALRQNSADAVAYQGKGNVLVGLECYDEALMVYEQALELAPLSITYVSKGHILTALGLYADAVTTYEQALALDASYASAYTGMGYALSQLGKTQEAEQAYQQAKQLGDDDWFLKEEG